MAKVNSKNASSRFVKKITGVLSMLAKDKNPLETIAGFAILFITAYFLIWGILTARTGNVSGYSLITNFASVGGLTRGSDVAVNGVRVGSISELRLNPIDYTVDVVMSIDSRYRFPKDTKAKITTYGIIGDKYIRLQIGTSTEFANSRDRIRSVPYRSLEEMIGNFIFQE